MPAHARFFAGCCEISSGKRRDLWMVVGRHQADFACTHYVYSHAHQGGRHRHGFQSDVCANDRAGKSDALQCGQFFQYALLHGHIESISRGITDRDVATGRELLADVNPTFNWGRMTCTVIVKPKERNETGKQDGSGEKATVDAADSGSTDAAHANARNSKR
jgi:hypothetical protein